MWPVGLFRLLKFKQSSDPHTFDADPTRAPLTHLPEQQQTPSIGRCCHALLPPPQVLEVVAEPAGLADQLDRGHHLAPRPPLPLSRHLRPPRHAGLWRQIQTAQAGQRRLKLPDAQGQL